ncbi:carbohydrate binding domain-containing protein [Fundicoccus sp. Sow4_H7]|uniref:carbohydrate binding domain-containing protein n=1 Tax=Fundicoccus sp. Sow4_H7 TaxID=3438784 RepID=UPI003F8F79C5
MKEIIKKFFSLIAVFILVWGTASDIRFIFANESSGIESEYLEDYQDTGVDTDRYQQVWNDEFEEDTLNRDDWNVELHQPGWVNEEWQEYIDNESVLQINDGNLVIQPVKETIDGQDYYYSGRVNTQNKHNFKYGFFEARVKVPKGQGYLPAFWLMSADENLYGQWPRSGEIDIMEIHGSNTTKSYGTIHYGNPHRESQGQFQLEDGDFSEEYHVFALEWLPGKINWFVDGNLIHTESEWYTRTEGQGEITYPAPFDSEFYVIFNLAIGGSWVGYPDDSTEFETQSYAIDYVRVYQQDNYDENVMKPNQTFKAREADETGNYIVNGEFMEVEALDDDANWVFLTTQGGIANAEIFQEQLVIETEAAGEVDYSVQLVHAQLPLEQNYQYRVTFNAWSDEARMGRVAVTGPDNGYIRYLEDQTFELNTEPTVFEYEFTMNQASDENGRLEFNFGNVNASSNIYLTDVRVERLAEVESSTTKSVLSNGNHVYNGQFQEGENRLGFWQWQADDLTQAVSSLEDGRRLIVEGSNDNNPHILFQEGLPLAKDIEYELSFELESNGEFELIVTIGDLALLIPVEEGLNVYRETFTLSSEQLENTDLTFEFNNNEAIRLDNVKVQENLLIKNGSFNAGLTGFNPFIDSSANASVVVDSLSEENAVDFTIYDTSDQAWKIQLIQENIPLLKGKTYRLSFKVKSSLERNIMYALQRDGKVDDNWMAYLAEQIIPVSTDYQEVSYEFTMEEADDLNALLSISLGAVDGVQIATEHRVVIDDIYLEEVN